MGDEANFVYMFPIGMAITVLDAESDDRKWIHALLNANELTMGYGGYGRSPVAKKDDQYEQDDVDEAASSGTAQVAEPVVLPSGESFEKTNNFKLEDDSSSQVRRVMEFGFCVAREVESGQESDHERCNARRGNRLNPGLVHLLLLRGKNFVHHPRSDTSLDYYY